MCFRSLIALVLGLLAPTTAAHAAQFAVTNLADSGTGSLRQAIINANAAAGADTITFSVSGAIVLGSQLPSITVEGGALTIDGTGRTVTISGNSAVRVMQVVAGTSLTVNNLTISNGLVFGDYGGGIYNNGTLTVTNSTFFGNSADSGVGGAISSNSGGTLTITNSTFSGNHATNGYGGGVYNNGAATITNSTFSGNGATVGAGIRNDNPAGVTLRNTIVANSVGAGDCFGTITNGGNNLDDDATCGWGAVSGSISLANPLLGALANNGGSTPTFALLTNSPAIDGVTFSAPNSAPSTDQRGVARPQGVRYDIGAFEGSASQAGPAFIVNVTADTSDGFCDVLGQGIGNQDCTLREAITAANALAGANGITFSIGGTITLASTLPAITDAAALTMNGAGQTLTISGNNAVQVMQVLVGASFTLNNVTIANGTGGGGGLANRGATTITNTTFSGNSALDNFGGAINNFNGGTLTIANSTFSGNSATNGFGGGVYNNGGPVTITNSTFSANSASGGFGAGIHNNKVAAQMTLRNTIVANSMGAGNCSGPITNGGNNLDSAATCGWGAVSGSMSSTNPRLGALANNGGSTATFALLTSSPAIDGVTVGAPNSAPSTDQRDVARPQGVRYDIGAFEGSETQTGPAFLVNASADTNDGFCDTPGQGIGNKDCTLREAITAANALAGANSITFSIGGTIILASTLPAITDTATLTMDGAGHALTISGNNAVRVMQVGIGAPFTLNNVTIANGTGFGGGLANRGITTITNTTFSGNSAPNSLGGAIDLGGGTLTIANSTFSGNSATSGLGAAINVSGGTLTIANSTFSGNSATSGLGGGVYNNGGQVTITNSTFSGNSAILGAGLHNAGLASQMTLRNTIVANSVGAGNCGGALINGGNNIDSGTTCGWGAVSGSMSSTNPLLGALATNGGRTQTFALLPGSPAIDGVTFSAPNGAPPTDQRGLARPRGVRYDIGAYEVQFTDEPLTAGLTIVKAVHVTELRIRIDAVRIAKGLGAYAWADPSLGPSGFLIRAQHIIDLRTALGQAYVQAARTPPSYAVDPPPSLAPGVVVKAAHIAEIRTALVNIE